MVQMEILFIYILLINLCLNQISETKINFIFQRTIYVKPNNKTKIISISTSNNTEKNDIKLFITENSINNTENYVQCGHGTNDKSIFHCKITSNGSYYFRYQFEEEKYQYLNQIVNVYNSIDEILTFKKSRETNCYYHNEIFSYTLTINKGINLNYSNINVFAYYPKSLLKNVSEPISHLLHNNKSNENVYVFNSNHSMNQYYIKVTENKDFEDPFGIIDSINFTNVRADDYFYPEMGKIRFVVDNCNFKPKNFVLFDKNNKSYEIKCNKTSIFYNSKSLFCYFNEKIDYYGPMKIFYGDGLIINNIFSTKTFSKGLFKEKNEDIFEINGTKYVNYTISLNNNYFESFYMNSINKAYINIINMTHDNIHIFERDVNAESDMKINLNEYNTLYILLKYDIGYKWTALKLERRIFEDENIQTAISVNYDLNWKLFDKLDEIHFDPDVIVLKNSAIISSNFSTKLIFESIEKNNLYGKQFCYNYDENNLTIHGNATKTFYCESSKDNYKIIRLNDENSIFPGYLSTQLNQFTNVTKLKIFKIEVLNNCQSNIFGLDENLEDATINVYFPIDLNKTVSVEYNGINIEENKKALIYNNPFDYTFKTFIVSRDLILKFIMII